MVPVNPRCPAAPEALLDNRPAAPEAHILDVGKRLGGLQAPIAETLVASIAVAALSGGANAAATA